MQPDLTDWFPPSVKPVRRGLYQTAFLYRSDDRPRWSYWTGERWGFECSTSAEAVRDYSAIGACQSKPWRGLADKP